MQTHALFTQYRDPPPIPPQRIEGRGPVEAEAWPGPQRLHPGAGPIECSPALCGWLPSSPPSPGLLESQGLTAGSRGCDGLTPTPPASILGVFPQQRHLLGEQGGTLKAPCHQEERLSGHGRNQTWACRGPCPDPGVVGNLGQATRPLFLAYCGH